MERNLVQYQRTRLTREISRYTQSNYFFIINGWIDIDIAKYLILKILIAILWIIGSTRNGRPASRIPVPLHRRDSALSLPGSISGRSTPMSDIYQPSFSVSSYQQSYGYQQRSKLPLQREGSLPSGIYRRCVITLTKDDFISSK